MHITEDFSPATKRIKSEYFDSGLDLGMKLKDKKLLKIINSIINKSKDASFCDSNLKNKEIKIYIKRESIKSISKLIRDKIPGNIKDSGSDLEVRVLSDKEFEEELIKKVLEEASELTGVSSREELVSELGDVMDVLDEIKVLDTESESILKAIRDLVWSRLGKQKK